MPDVISSSLFSGTEKINPDDLGITEVSNFSTKVDSCLREHFKSQGKATGGIGLCLSPDNTKVVAGSFFVRGNLDIKEVKFHCNHIWPDSPKDVHIVINFPSADMFTFDEGGLYSDPLPSSSIVHSFHTRDGSVLLADAREILHIGDFSARIICQLSSTSNSKKGIMLKYMIIIFPCSADKLQDSPESRFPGWPGLKVAEGTFPLGPRPSTPWGCPIVPFIRPGAPYTEIPMAPSSRRLRAAISTIMRKTSQPDALRSGAHVLDKWERIRSNPRSISTAPALVTWPEVIMEPDPPGRKCFSII